MNPVVLEIVFAAAAFGVLAAFAYFLDGAAVFDELWNSQVYLAAGLLVLILVVSFGVRGDQGSRSRQTPAAAINTEEVLQRSQKAHSRESGDRVRRSLFAVLPAAVLAGVCFPGVVQQGALQKLIGANGARRLGIKALLVMLVLACVV